MDHTSETHRNGCIEISRPRKPVEIEKLHRRSEPIQPGFLTKKENATSSAQKIFPFRSGTMVMAPPDNTLPPSPPSQYATHSAMDSDTNRTRERASVEVEKLKGDRAQRERGDRP